MRILQIHPFLKGEGLNPRAGGKSRLSLQLSRELALRGHDVAIFPFPEPLLEKPYTIENAGKPLTLLPTACLPALRQIVPYYWKVSQMPGTDRSLHEVRLMVMFLAGLNQAVKDFRPDIIHNHMSFSDLPLLYYALGLQTPLLLTHHTNTAGRHLDSYRMVIFVSEALRDLVCGQHPALLDRSRLIHPAVERVFSDPAVPITGKRHGILFVGGLRLDKGLQHLLAAYAQSPALRKVPLRVCGVGPEQENFETFARSHRIPVKLLVNPSPGEAFSLALAEAMCCGTPVIGWKPQVEESSKLLQMPCGGGFDPAHSIPKDLVRLIEGWRHKKETLSLKYRKDLAIRARRFFSIERYATENLFAYDEGRDSA
jgi:glycosyltransferase involved in cell wall biosynthesis